MDKNVVPPAVRCSSHWFRSSSQSSAKRTWENSVVHLVSCHVVDILRYKVTLVYEGLIRTTRAF